MPRAKRSSLVLEARLTSLLPAATDTASAPKPPRTVGEAVRQARQSLRLYREATAAAAAGEHTAGEAAARSAGAASTSAPGSQPAAGPRKLIVELPLPSRPTGFLGRDLGSEPDLVRLLDESDWPGGETQRCRAIKGLVDPLLEGYGAQFMGYLEDEADGVGLWAMEGITVVANVTNATVPSLVKLLDGGYGAKVQQPGHTLIAVNPMWISGDVSSVGQPWQLRLRQRAKEAIDEAGWDTLYACKMVRSSRGGNAMLHRAWPHRWTLYPAPTPDAAHLGECALAASTKPSRQQLLQLINDAKPAMQAKAKELGLDDRSGRLW